MQMRNVQVVSRRRGFTLVELLVVIAIIAALAAITAAILPNIARTEKVTQAANMIQGMLLAAKQRAARDQVGSGVRFLLTKDPKSSTRTICTEMLYVIKPDDLFVSGDLMSLSNAAPFTATSTTQDFSGGLYLQDATQTSEQYPVQEGDYLELYGGGTVTAITSVQQTGGTGPYNTLNTYSNPSTGQPVTDYRIIRGPRRVIGEDSVKLPSDVVIAISDTTHVPPSLSWNVPQRQVPFGAASGTATVFYEILFSPTGSVMGQGTASTDKIILLVWNSSLDKYTDGEPALVVVNVLTGAISIQPVDTKSASMYTFAQDPRLSGM
jgi:prepilin-type N-terminal cleavage/methylation domain-containing protein